MKKKLVVMLMTALVCTSLCMGCGDKEDAAAEEEVTLNVEPIPEAEPVVEAEPEPVEEETEEVPVDELPEGYVRSELTNLPIPKEIENQRPIAAMVDNESLALPHYGIAEADIVYELMNLKPSEQEKHIDRILDESESFMIKKYIKMDKFNINSFITELDTLIEKLDPKVYIYTGDKNSNYDFISDKIQTIYDSSVNEGIRISYKGKLYDYSL